MAFCTNCGHQLAEGAKFCFECGAKVNEPVGSREESRKVVYDGEIHKCPNCGELLNSFKLRCDVCGYELRGNKGSSIVQKFADELKQIEDSRGRGLKNRIITHISTFPVPNSKEELLEFLILSASHISEDRYKEDTSSTKKEISDAWEAKFEQAYHKAIIVFENDSSIHQVETIYKAKKEEIRKNRMRGVFTGFWFKWALMICFMMFILWITKIMR